ncbi:hypothetical protein [Sulfitobacter sp.]|uniref:hypothetical protein n=1 Tax=Sulfitobacter sp. TaxID=1903071 RepID=UPI00300149F9
MTLSALKPANALAARFEIEPFADVAFAELAACPLVEPGICMNPLCSQHFVQTRSWQRYCSTTCRKMDELDMRRIGHKAAPALLAWRAGKYEKTNDELRALSRVGRNYVSRLSSDWWNDRLRRMAERGTL